MPCDSVQTTTVAFKHSTNLRVLADALKDAGWSITLSEDNVYAFREGTTFNLRRGDAQATITISRYANQTAEQVAAEANRLFTVRTVKELAKKFNYPLKNIDKTGLKMTFGRK